MSIDKYIFVDHKDQIFIEDFETGHQIILHFEDDDVMAEIDKFEEDLLDNDPFLDCYEVEEISCACWEDWISSTYSERVEAYRHFRDNQFNFKVPVNTTFNIPAVNGCPIAVAFPQHTTPIGQSQIGYQSDFVVIDEIVTTAGNNPTSKKVGFKSAYTRKEEGKNPMCYNKMTVETTSTASIEKSQRDYLHGKLYDVKYKIDEDLRAKFRMDPNTPRNIGEFIERIKSGAFTVKEEYKKKDSYYFRDYISWNDPANPADEVGYLKANTALNAAFDKAQRTITIMDPKEGLKALEEFESATFH